MSPRPHPSRTAAAATIAAAALILGATLGLAADAKRPPRGTLPRLPADRLAASWWSRHGGFFHAGADPSLPAVLLIHGNHESATNWTDPARMEQHYDYRRHPGAKKLGKKSVPNAGIYKVSASPWLDLEGRSWVEFLRARGYTVAGYSQSPGTIAEIMEEAEEGFARFLSETAALQPGSPPPVAILAHSRGGLIARHILKRQGAAGRVRWLVTLHTPHQGSEMAVAPRRLADEAVEAAGGAHLPEPFQGQLRELARKIASPLWKMIDDQSKELRPGSPMFLALEEGERPVAGVHYHTFGGTNPDFYRMYVWTFTPMSSVPQYRGLKQYFAWEVKPAEVGAASPMYGSVKHIAPEITPGKGDGLVSDARARLPESFGAVHHTDDLNHAEVLWDRALQDRVDRILTGGPRSAAAAARLAR